MSACIGVTISQHCLARMFHQCLAVDAHQLQKHTEVQTAVTSLTKPRCGENGQNWSRPDNKAAVAGPRRSVQAGQTAGPKMD